ncbi:MAG: hypothetical protein KBG82_02815 [Spirochaetes bacterium]|nr:hypothetical protein [Spirochaetota bacterium]
MDKDKFVPNNSNDEISLLDILKIIWKYRWFIIIFTVVISLICALTLYINSKNDFNNNKNAFYIYINLPGISYNLYQYLDIQLKYDLNQGYLSSKFSIEKISVETPDIKAKPYKPADFPVVQLKVNVKFSEKVSNVTFESFEKYIKDIIFQKKLLDTVNALKTPIQQSSSVIGSNNNLQTAEIILLFTKITENLNSIFDLRNDDIDTTYKLAQTYIDNFDPKISYLKEAKNICLKACDNIYFELSSLKFSIKEIDTISTNILSKSFISKVLIAFLCSLLLAIFLVFIIDFFRKYGKEIVR